MRLLFMIYALCGAYLSSAQNFQSHDSFSGYAVTHTDTTYGKLSINLEANQVLLKENNSFINFSVRQLKKVVINKPDSKQIFYSGPFGLNNEPFLFRALADGALPLLYREGIKFSKYEEEVLPPYFVLIGRQVFTLGEKKEILELFGVHKKQVLSFVKTENIKFKSEEDLIRVFNYYNSLGENADIPGTDG